MKGAMDAIALAPGKVMTISPGCWTTRLQRMPRLTSAAGSVMKTCRHKCVADSHENQSVIGLNFNETV